MASKNTLELRKIKQITTFLGDCAFSPAPHDSFAFKHLKIKGQYIPQFKAGDVIKSRDGIHSYIVAPDMSFVRLIE